MTSLSANRRSGHAPHGLACGTSTSPRSVRVRMAGVSMSVFEADCGAPFVHHPQIAERVGARHAGIGRIRCGPRGSQRLRRRPRSCRCDAVRRPDDLPRPPSAAKTRMVAVPPCLPPANQNWSISIRPCVPKIRRTLSCASETEQETSAMMPFGKCSTAGSPFVDARSRRDGRRQRPCRGRARPFRFVDPGNQTAPSRPDSRRHRGCRRRQAHSKTAGARDRRAALAKPKLDLINADFADGLRFQQVDQLRRQRMQAVHIGFAEERAGLAGSLLHRLGLGGRKAHRLFTEYVLAVLGRLDRPFGMARMRRGDIDGIDRRIGEQGVVAMDDARTGKALGKTRLVGIACADRLDADRCRTVRRRQRNPWRCGRGRECPSGFCLCSSCLNSFSDLKAPDKERVAPETPELSPAR